MTDSSNLQKKLIALGFNKDQLQIIDKVAEEGFISISALSNSLKIPRSTIYRYLDILEEKGLIHYELTTQGKKIILGDIHSIVSSIDNKKSELDNLSVTLKSYYSNLKSESKSKVLPKVNLYKGQEGIRQLVWNTLSSKSMIKVYTNAMRKDVLGEKWMVNYWLDFIRKGLKDKVLGDLNYAKDSYQKFGSRKDYYLPVIEFYRRSNERVINSTMLDVKGEIYIYDNVFAFYTWEKGDLVGTEIISSYLYQTQSSIFDFLWSQTTENDSIDKYLE